MAQYHNQGFTLSVNLNIIADHIYNDSMRCSNKYN